MASNSGGTMGASGQASSDPEADRVLDGWKAIAEHLGTGVRNAQRWAKERGLPVHAVQRHRVVARTFELDAWLASSNNPRNVPELGGDRAPAGNGPATQGESPASAGLLKKPVW